MVSKIVIIVVLILNVVAFGLAVNAERKWNAAKIIADRDLNYKYCRYDPDNDATGYALGAFSCLLASQVVVLAVTQCLCCGKGLNPGQLRTYTITLFIMCWVTFITAELCLLIGSVRNGYNTINKAFDKDQEPSCEMRRKRVFAIGAIFIFLTTIISELYYVAYSTVKS